MKVGKNLSEDKYLKERVEKYNKEERGKGDRFKKSWLGAREDRYEPKFETLRSKYLSKYKMDVVRDKEAKYTLIVKTVYTEPGFNIGVMKRPASVTFEFVFVETATGKIKAKYFLDKVPGSQMNGYDFDACTRIAESYAKAGKMLGAYIAKGVK
jgi:hypothetical protein